MRRSGRIQSAQVRPAEPPWITDGPDVFTQALILTADRVYGEVSKFASRCPKFAEIPAVLTKSGSGIINSGLSEA